MITTDSISKIVDLFRSLQHPDRLTIVKALINESFSVKALMGITGLEQAMVSHHLKILRMQKMVTVKRDGKFRIYSINNSVFNYVTNAISNYSKNM